jgi:hypothetical protein
MNYNNESKPAYAQEIEKPGIEYNENEKTDAAHRAEAIMAENVEHNMTVLEAVKAYPMASFWAFVFSCTIVRYPSTKDAIHAAAHNRRSWNPTTCSSLVTSSLLMLSSKSSV